MVMVRSGGRRRLAVNDYVTRIAERPPGMHHDGSGARAGPPVENPMAVVRLEALRKEYPGGHVAVADATLEIADGELLVLVGPSGCGKTIV